ncbi:unnamed protein product, partial [Ixodes pacificus]
MSMPPSFQSSIISSTAALHERPFKQRHCCQKSLCSHVKPRQRFQVSTIALRLSLRLQRHKHLTTRSQQREIRRHSPRVTFVLMDTKRPQQILATPLPPPVS